MTQPPHLVFEEVSQRFNEFKSQFFGQATNIVMQLDGIGRPIGCGTAFDHVRIERTLGEKCRPGDLLRFGSETGDELVTNPPAFLLGFGDSRQGRQKTVFCAYHM